MATLIYFAAIKAPHDQKSAMYWVDHTQEVLLQTATLEAHIQAAVAAGRGFAVTKNEDVRGQFEAAAQDISADLTSLRALTTDNLQQKTEIGRLVPLIRLRMGLLQRFTGMTPPIGATTSSGRDGTAAPAAVTAARLVAASIDTIKGEETRLLAQRRRALARVSFNTTVGLIVGAALLSASALSMLVLLDRRNNDRRHMEALRRSEDFLDRTGRAAATGGWEVDLATGVVRWTVETYRLHGVDLDYRPTVEAGVAFYEPDARPLIRAVLDRAMSDGTPWDLELPSTRADGQRIWLRVVGARETAPHGAGRLIGSIQDVTTQVSAREALRHAHERATLATDSGQIGIWDWDIPGETMVWDAWMYRLYGLPPKDEAPAMTAWLGHLHPDDHEAAQRALYDARDGKHPFDTEFRIVHADQSVRYLRATGRVSHAADGRAVRMVGAAWDVTTQRTLMAELASQHELLRVTLHSIGDGVITTDAHGNVAFLNAVAERLTGWPTTAAAGHALTEVFHIINDDTREPADNPVAVCLSDNRTVAHSNHILLIARDGTEFGIQNSAAPIHSEQGEILGAVLVFHDVTEQRHLSEEMSYRACHDMLTGLLNRAEFEVRLRFALHKAQTDRSENVLLFIDLDQFKLVNDACGHAAGDRLLQQVAKLLGESVRASDTLGRLGGDEFAIVLDHCSTTQAAVLAEQICERMDRFRFVHEGQRFRIGASVGLVPLDERWPTTSALLQAADGACYAAKEAGRNRVQIWTETDEGLRTRQGETQLATRLAQALDEDRFLLFAQRIEPLGVGPSAGIHAEVLLRMVERDGTVTSPGAFLPAAERFHLASRIDRWVLSKVIRWMQDLDSLANIEMVCVNLSGQSVGDRAFHAWAADVLLRAGPSIQHRLCLEITETTAVTNLTDAAVFIAEMRALGVRVALDDFGAGASSFGYLKAMPVDFLKIDGQFIRNLMSDPLDQAAVRCFADVAAVVGMRTVAEFVDQATILQKLREMGIDFAQGFFVHRPAPIADLVAAIDLSSLGVASAARSG